MGIKEWYGSRSPTPSTRLGQPKPPPKWQILLQKFKKEKKKSFSSGTVISHSQQTSYDPKTYSKNFDRGMGWTESDNMSRSFSARFANPSRVLYRNDLLD